MVTLYYIPTNSVGGPQILHILLNANNCYFKKLYDACTPVCLCVVCMYVSAYLCDWMYLCMWMQVCAGAPVIIWRSVENCECHSLPSALFEAEHLVPCCIPWASWPTSFYAFSLLYSLPWCKRAGNTDAYFCIQVNSFLYWTYAVVGRAISLRVWFVFAWCLVALNIFLCTWTIYIFFGAMLIQTFSISPLWIFLLSAFYFTIHCPTIIPCWPQTQFCGVRIIDTIPLCWALS